MAGNLISGQDPGGAIRPIEVDENGNLRVDLVSGVSVSTVIDSTTPLQIHQVSGSSWSTSVLTISGSAGSVAVSGTVASDVADDGNPPVKIGGIGRTTNPAVVADNDVVVSTHDKYGRQVVTPYQVRDLVATAYLALTTGTETALLAGAASTLHDLVYVMGANQSDAAIDVDFRSGTGGAVLFSLTVPADASAGFVPAVPFPQTEAAQAWTADMGDLTGTTVNLTALFIKNV